MTSRFAIAKARLLDDLETIVPELIGVGRKQCVKKPGAFHCASPGSGRPAPDQMVIWRQGARRGGWKDFVGGHQGDAIDLVAYVKFGTITGETRKAAVDWAFERFGLGTMDKTQQRALEKDAKDRREALEREEAKRRKENFERVRKTFFAAQEQIAGTPVEAYLASRGIVLDQIPNLAKSLRFYPDFEYWLERGKRFPAMLAAMVDADGKLRAYHATYLSPSRSGHSGPLAPGQPDRSQGCQPLAGFGKAPVEKSKLMWPEVAGFNIRLTYGRSGLNCHEAAEAGVMDWVGMGEGIEDGLSAAIAYPDLRMHAAGSLSGLLHAPDLACAKGYLIFRDNDWDKPQATELFERAMTRFRSFGKPVEEISMPASWGKDVNDALNFRED